MDNDYNKTITEFKINMFEYCTLMEDITLPDDTEAYIKLHKLMPYCSASDVTTSDSIFINDDECKPKVSGTVSLDDRLKVPIISGGTNPNAGTPIYSTMTDQEGTTTTVQTGQKIPKGSIMIALFMDNNINDGYLTTWVTL